MDVLSTYNATYAKNLHPTFFEQARDLVNWQQYQVFSDTSLSGIGNIAFQIMWPGILNVFDRTANLLDSLKPSHYAISYKPFLSLFGMIGGVNYAASAVFEPASADPRKWHDTVNGMDTPLSMFMAVFGPVVLNSTLEGCDKCGQTTECGCAMVHAASSSRHQRSTRIMGAGFIEAGVTAAVFLMVLGALMFLNVLTLGVGRQRQRRSAAIGEKDARMPGDELVLHSEADSKSQVAGRTSSQGNYQMDAP